MYLSFGVADAKMATTFKTTKMTAATFLLILQWLTDWLKIPMTTSFKRFLLISKIDKKDNPAAIASSRSKDDAEQRDQIGRYFQKIFGNKFRCKSSPNIW